MMVRAVLLVALVWTGVARAAEFRVVDLPNGGGSAIQFGGVIQPGDQAIFHDMASKLGKAMVITTGPGGSVVPALAIGSEIRARGWSTLVPPGTNCASACSLIWLAGTTRLLGQNAQIGFHALALMANGQKVETHDGDYILRKWLNDLGYEEDATATIVNTHAASIRWYDGIELRANGIPNDPYP
jgi:hypothetical protein